MNRSVAVLLATFDGAPFLCEQLDSILAQEDVEVTIIARDDGSGDDTPAWLAAWREKDPARIRLVQDDLGRLGSASANFFRLATMVDANEFDFFAFADQDDIWLPDKLARAITQLKETGANGYSSNLLAFREGRPTLKVIDKAQPEKRWDYLFQSASAGCTYVLSASAFHVVQTALSRMPTTSLAVSHDWTIYALCRSNSVRWVHDASATILYRQHAANVYGALPGMRGLLVRLRAARSGWYRRHIEWLGKLLDLSAEEREIVARISRNQFADRLWLAIRCGSFRRRLRDQLFLCLAFLTGTI